MNDLTPRPPFRNRGEGESTASFLLRRSVLCGLFLILLVACDLTPPPPPTVSSLSMAQTAVIITQNAAPAGFDRVAFPVIDANLTNQPAWYASVAITFDGLFVDGGAKAMGTLDAQIYRNELTTARRVLFKASGTAFGVVGTSATTNERGIEAVRLSNDYYQVMQNVCSKTDDVANRQIADLSPGVLLGGVTTAHSIGSRDTLNKFDAWEYGFAPDSVTVPIVHPAANGTLTVAAGDLWVAPSVNAVVKFTLTVNVQNVTLLSGDRLVSGQLRETYMLNEAGTLYNISIPFGC